MNPCSGTTLSHKRILVAAVVVIGLAATTSQAKAGTASTAETAATHDVAHDFDWEIGTWRTTVQVLADPLSDTPDEWLRFRGTSVVKQLGDHRANVVELDVSGPAGRIQALNLRLYESGADRWSSTFTNLRDGLLTPSIYGTFEDGVGTFYGDDQLAGRPIVVRFVITREGRNKARFEQAYSDDGGTTWEVNWRAVDRRAR